MRALRWLRVTLVPPLTFAAWLLAGWLLPLSGVPDTAKSALLGILVTAVTVLAAGLLAPSRKGLAAFASLVLGAPFLADAVVTNPACLFPLAVWTGGAVAAGLVVSRFGWRDQGDAGWPGPLRGLSRTAFARRVLPAAAFGVVVARLRLHAFGLRPYGEAGWDAVRDFPGGLHPVVASGGVWNVGFAADGFGFGLDAALSAAAFVLVLAAVRRFRAGRASLRPTRAGMAAALARAGDVLTPPVLVLVFAVAYYDWLTAPSIAVAVAAGVRAACGSRGRLARVVLVLSLVVLCRPALTGHHDVVRRRLPHGGALYQSTRGTSYPVELLYLRPPWSLALVPLGENPLGNRCPTYVSETRGRRGERVIMLERQIARDTQGPCAIDTPFPPPYAAFVGEPSLLGVRWLATARRFPRV